MTTHHGTPAADREAAWSLLRAADVIVLDIDGVLCLGDEPIPGAGDAVAMLRHHPVLIATNDSRRSPAGQRLRLDTVGAADLPLITATDALIRELRGAGHTSVAAVGTVAFEDEIRGAGFDVGETGATAVVTGAAVDLDEDTLARAARVLERAAWFATNTDLTVPSRSGDLPDAGEVIRRLKERCGRDPVICGKPFAPMSRLASERLGAARNVVVVGDGVGTDVAWAAREGWRSIHVRGAASPSPLADCSIPDLGCLVIPAEECRSGATTPMGSPK